MIDLASIPEHLFYRGVKNREIVQVSILTDIEEEGYKQQGLQTNEIMVVGGEKQLKGKFLSRDSLVRNFRNLDGSKIRLLGWHYKTKYNVYREVNVPVALIRIPNKYLGIDSKTKNSLLVFQVNNGKVDRRNYYVVNSIGAYKLFRSSHVVLEEPNKKIAIREMEQAKKVRAITEEREKLDTITYRNPLIEKKEVDTLPNAPYTVVALLLKRNTVGNSVKVGYRVKRKSDGVEKDCNFNSVKTMCVAKEIDNLTIAQMNGTGKEYFRGIGIRIENLPTKYV